MEVTEGHVDSIGSCRQKDCLKPRYISWRHFPEARNEGIWNRAFFNKWRCISACLCGRKYRFIGI